MVNATRERDWNSVMDTFDNDEDLMGSDRVDRGKMGCGDVLG
jgi:hypothetical protein